jgi:TPR repeat protein
MATKQFIFSKYSALLEDKKTSLEEQIKTLEEQNKSLQVVNTKSEEKIKSLEKDIKTVIERFKDSADRTNDALTQSQIGYLYGCIDSIKDDDMAFKYVKLAADQGHIVAQSYIGHLYVNGIGTTKNNYLAFINLKLAADKVFEEAQYNGINREAQFNIGSFYENGIGIEQNDAMAFKYFKLVADQGVNKDETMQAQCKIGSFYENGIGIEKDDAMAFKYYKLVADQGVEVVQDILGCLYENGIGVNKDNTMAYKYYKLAADQGYIYAQIKINELNSVELNRKRKRDSESSDEREHIENTDKNVSLTQNPISTSISNKSVKLSNDENPTQLGSKLDINIRSSKPEEDDDEPITFVIVVEDEPIKIDTE